MVRNRDTNRNDAIGEHAAFAPVRRSLDEIIKGSLKHRPEEPRTSKELLRHGRLALVRYRLGSDEIRRDMKDDYHFSMQDAPDCWAAFGVIDRETDSVVFTIQAVTESNERPELVNPKLHGPIALSPDEAMVFLNYLDVPASRRNGCDLRMAQLLGGWYDADAGNWSVRPPLHVMVVKFERICFGLTPAITESIEVFLPVDPEQDIDDPVAERAYWAKHHYKDSAWEELNKLPAARDVRPGFSSWMPASEVRKSKVVESKLYAAVTEMMEAMEAAPPSP